ncbi:unnamed protein product [Staurois parvus]|uniref:Uncharacterized protein n=1 Tax=Staurois parvus TaxID=386267 RepID=A0ABN9BVZ9_9NEOB|nr:unnamed protein product [Staurois parvus]
MVSKTLILFRERKIAARNDDESRGTKQHILRYCMLVGETFVLFRVTSGCKADPGQ